MAGSLSLVGHKAVKLKSNYAGDFCKIEMPIMWNACPGELQAAWENCLREAM
jgi:hypothetical protein